LETISNLSNIKQLDWCGNNETIAMLVGNEVVLYGPNVSLPSITRPSEVPVNVNYRVVSFDVSNNNSIAYVVQYFLFTTGYQEVAIIKSSNGNTIELKGDFTESLAYVNFSSDNQFILGSSSITDDPKPYEELRTLYIYDDVFTEELFTTFSSSERNISPVYTHRTLKTHLWSAYRATNSNSYFLRGLNFTVVLDGENIPLEDYSPSFVDLK